MYFKVLFRGCKLVLRLLQLQEWHRIGISDDDQALVYQLQFHHPWLFEWFENATFMSLFRWHLNSPVQRTTPALGV